MRTKPGETAEYAEGDNKLFIHSKKKKVSVRRYSLKQLIEEQKLIQNELNKDMDWVREAPCGKEML